MKNLKNGYKSLSQVPPYIPHSVTSLTRLIQHWRGFLITSLCLISLLATSCARTFTQGDNTQETILNIRLQLTFNGPIDPTTYNYIMTLRTSTENRTVTPLQIPNSSPTEFLPTPGIEFNDANDVFLTKLNGLNDYYTDYFNSWSSYITYYQDGTTAFIPAVTNPTLSPLTTFPSTANIVEHANFGTFPLNARVQLTSNSSNPQYPGQTIPNSILTIEFQSRLIGSDAQYVYIGVITTKPSLSDINNSQYAGIVIDSTQDELIKIQLKNREETSVIFNAMGNSDLDSADIIQVGASLF